MKNIIITSQHLPKNLHLGIGFFPMLSSTVTAGLAMASAHIRC